MAVPDAPRIERPLNGTIYTGLGGLILAGNEETDLYNQTIPPSVREGRKNDERAVDDHNDAVEALQAECDRRIAEWLKG